jgi:hypothetical protein
MLSPDENRIVFIRVTSSLPAFLCGSQVDTLDKTYIPPIWAAQIFPSPGQQERLFSSRFEFFHSFSLEKGGIWIFNIQ